MWCGTRATWARTCTASRASSTPKSRGGSSRPWGSPSTRSHPSSRSISHRGRWGPERERHPGSDRPPGARSHDQHPRRHSAGAGGGGGGPPPPSSWGGDARGRGGERALPIWIGPAEASAIAMELAGVKFARPLTHDLLKQVILGLGADLRKVIITQVKENTYYAELHIYRGDAVIQIDARPSDSIAVALRLKAPIFTSEGLLALTSVETGEPGGESGSGPLDPDALKNYLQNLDPEDFGKFTP